MDEEILRELHKIGFSGFIHLDKKKRDGKRRWTWNYPIENKKDGFTVLLVEERGTIFIERLTNPFGRDFKADQLKELIRYIKTDIIK